MRPNQVWQEHTIRRCIEGYPRRAASDDAARLILTMMPTDEDIRTRLRLSGWSDDQIDDQLLGLKDAASTAFVLR